MEQSVLLRGADFADYPQRGARAVEVRRVRREEPVFKAKQRLLLALGFLDLGKTVHVGMKQQFVGQRTASAEK